MFNNLALTITLKMNRSTCNQFQNVNKSCAEPHEKKRTCFTPVSINPFVTSTFKSDYSKMLMTNEVYVNLMQQKSQDCEYILNYILKKKNACKTKINKDSQLKIYQARDLLVQIISLKKQLKDIKRKLNINDKNFDVKLNVAKEIMTEVSNCFLKFNTSQIQNVQAALLHRAKSRRNISKRKFKLFQLTKEAKKKESEKHHVINTLLNKKKEEVNRIKTEEGLKRQADSVLHKVRAKKLETKKILSTLNALSKLREVRSQEELAKGGYCSKVLTDTFNSVINHFQEVWKKQLEEYHAEEKGLKIMLQGSTVQEPNRTKSKYRSYFYQWEEAMFGNFIPLRSHILNVSESDEESLIKIREKWDEYLVAFPTVMSSVIPSGWVLPPETEDKNWLEFARGRTNL